MDEVWRFVDGARVPPERYVISGDDDGLLLGLTAFETLRTYGGCLFRARRHMARLVASAAAIDVACPSPEALVAEIAASVDGYPVEARVRLTLTRGGARLLSVAPLASRAVAAPLRAVTMPWEPPPWLDGRVKHGSRASGEVARRHAGVDEVLWVGRDGCLTEGVRSSIFAVVDGVLVTPPDDGRILAGITREALLEAAAEAGVGVREQALLPFSPMTELYVSSTLKELAPIVELDGRSAPGAGPVGAAVSAAFHLLVGREIACSGCVTKL